MEFAMTVSERKGAAIAMIDSRSIVDVRAICKIFKITIIKLVWIFVQENKTIRRAKPGSKIAVFKKRPVCLFKVIILHLVISRIRSAIHVGRTRSHSRQLGNSIQLLIRRTSIDARSLAITTNGTDQCADARNIVSIHSKQISVGFDPGRIVSQRTWIAKGTRHPVGNGLGSASKSNSSKRAVKINVVSR